jgi:radical SAM protein with 4Fe4S-binding SPASM domain
MGRNFDPQLDQVAFEKLRRIASGMSAAQRAAGRSSEFTSALPEELAFKLTNRCDLRCNHCYQWKEDGYHRQLAPAELRTDLDLAVIKKVLDSTRKVRSNVYLWGGEPLVYRYWDGLVDLLEDDPRWTSLCTNGTLIEKRLESLLRISAHLEVSISIDGFEDAHDAIRGKGMFEKTMGGLKLLVDKKRRGEFKGEITVNCVLSDNMIARFCDFVAFLEQEGVDKVYISFPWFLSENACANMDRYFTANFSLLQNATQPSWYSYNFKLKPTLVEDIVNLLADLKQRQWEIKIRYNPELDEKDICDFIGGSDKPAQGKTRCQSIHSRMDVFPDGQVVSCKFFPEFSVGNIKDEAVNEVWNGERFKRMRETISKCGLMPVCAKCNLLYTRGG